ncbi:MAG TPA: TonB-dependent receptor [Chitinophagaceae bacterium]|nr:TonB-dependent receptor [Chitinophagaceae bacterium]
MKKIILTTMLICLISQVIFSQTQTATVTGKITNEKNEPIAGASVREKNTTTGAVTDKQGQFSLSVRSLPSTLVVSATEHNEKEISVTNTDAISITIQSAEKVLGEVIIGVPGDVRINGKLINVPVSIERVGKPEYNNSPTDFYGTLLTRKNLDVTVSSITFKTYSTRGFNGSGSSRVNQLMDGMDNQAPGMNFYLGNFLGLSDLDIESIEVLPGASSALYGPGGVNGTILVNSKNPFKSPGLSLIVKNGITDVGKKQRSKIGGYYDYTLRWAKNFNDKFAFKINAQYLQANDWLANDTTNYLRSGGTGKGVEGTRQTDPNYDGVNVYGDETTFNMKRVAEQMVQLGFLPPQALALVPEQSVSRTGYNEIDVIDPKTKNIKFNGALHYKISDALEAILAGHWATGNTVYTGNNRYVLKDIKLGQYKVELKHKNWFLRGYTTQEDAGEAYTATVTSQYFNEAWNPSGFWYPEYVGAFVQAKGGGAPDLLAHTIARGYADRNRPAAGSAKFNHLFDSVRAVPISKGGGLFVENSQLWMAEGQYNLANKIKFADILVGGNVKKYILSSEGTLFIDKIGSPIKINEWGVYGQVTKKLLSEKLVIGISGRYDKNENFEGKFTPRFTALIKVADGHNLRASYQTAYKFPTTQQQWIKLNVGDVVLLGGLPWVNDTMNTKVYPTYVYNSSGVSPYTYKALKPESMQSFEVGYKGYIDKKLLIDMYAYFGKYTNFLGRIVLLQPTNNNKVYSIVTNSETEVKTWGAGIGFDYKMANNFFSFFNAYTDNLTDVPSGFQAGFSTPKYRFNAGLGNSGLGKSEKIGFNINLRWQDDFYWESGGLADGTVKAYTTLDAQVNYKLKKIKSMIKLGGTNITNKFYQTGFGNPYIGGMYYLSFAYNIL